VNKLIGNPDESAIAGILKFVKLGTGAETAFVKLGISPDGASRYRRIFWYKLLSIGLKSNISA
jgi:hypothetical protein